MLREVFLSVLARHTGISDAIWWAPENSVFSLGI